ncbi:regulator of nonsense transcripts 3A-like [Penaeus japonicus]|uniref:regulator of nonsense transcripts 3A-like n=1 Tax=Penaeus japonicus TaxID=27405 RepID=UPI001C712C48|nr:regulator of nonsense transcripts 3A-like [Penaeus japonicus]
MTVKTSDGTRKEGYKSQGEGSSKRTSEKPHNRGKREKNVPHTKVVARRLPPSMTEEEFLEAVSPLAEYDYFIFVPADRSLGSYAFSRAYINFKNTDDVFTFRDRFDSYVFVDKKGNEYPAMVEYAPFQKIPKRIGNKKKDIRAGTIDQDPDFMAFLESLEKPETVQLPTLEVVLEEIQAHERELKANNGIIKVKTPLLEFIEQKKAEKLRTKEERREERRRKEFERKKAREDDKKKRKDFRDHREMKKEEVREVKEDGSVKVREVLRPERGKESYAAEARQEKTRQERDRERFEREKEKQRRRDEERQKQREREKERREKEKQIRKEREREERMRRLEEKTKLKEEDRGRYREDAREETGEDKKGWKRREEAREDAQMEERTQSGKYEGAKSKRYSEGRRKEEREREKRMKEEKRRTEKEAKVGEVEEEGNERQEERGGGGGGTKVKEKEIVTIKPKETSPPNQGEMREEEKPPVKYSQREGEAEKEGAPKEEFRPEEKIRKRREKDPRAERRIRNKDRPTMALYRPGQTRLSASRAKQDRAEADDTSSSSPSPVMPSGGGETKETSRKSSEPMKDDPPGSSSPSPPSPPPKSEDSGPTESKATEEVPETAIKWKQSSVPEERSPEAKRETTDDIKVRDGAEHMEPQEGDVGGERGTEAANEGRKYPGVKTMTFRRSVSRE